MQIEQVLDGVDEVFNERIANPRRTPHLQGEASRD